jgi:hypothetical protein
MVARYGRQAVELLTVPAGRQGERTDLDTSGPNVPRSVEERKDKRLRAVLRSPE